MITDVFLNQMRVNICEQKVKMASHEFFTSVTREIARGRGEGMEGKLSGDYLRLILGLCLEDRTN